MIVTHRNPYGPGVALPVAAARSGTSRSALAGRPPRVTARNGAAALALGGGLRIFPLPDVGS